VAKVRVDFSQAKEFEAIPGGAYPMVLDETEVREGSGEYPYVNWTFKIETGEFAGRKQWLMTSLSPKATWRLKDTLRALGETHPDLDSDGFEMDPDDYVGRRCIGNVIQETYQNKLQNKIDSIAAANGAAASSGSRVVGIR